MRAAVLVLALLVPATAVAAGPPSATTGAAKNVTQTAATVTGTVDPQGMATTYHFEYGTSTSYGLQTAERRGLGHRRRRRLGGPQRADHRHDLPLPRRGDQRRRGHARQPDHTLRTAARPGRPGRRPARRATSRRWRARLDGFGRPQRPRHDLSLRVRHEHGLRQAHAEAGAGSGRSARSVSANIAGLTPNTRYHYRVVATNDAASRAGATALHHAAQPAGHHRLGLAQPRALERLDHRQREGQRAGRRRHDRRAGAPGLPLRRAVLPGGDQGGLRATARSPSRSARCGRWPACA